MNQFTFKNFYRRNLPHIQPEGATLFITFRLANSLPKEVIEKLLTEKEETEKKINQIAEKEEQEKQFDLAQRRFFDKMNESLWSPDGSFVIVALAQNDQMWQGGAAEIVYVDGSPLVTLVPFAQEMKWGP